MWIPNKTMYRGYLIEEYPRDKRLRGMDIRITMWIARWTSFTHALQLQTTLSDYVYTRFCMAMIDQIEANNA